MLSLKLRPRQPATFSIRNVLYVRCQDCTRVKLSTHAACVRIRMRNVCEVHARGYQRELAVYIRTMSLTLRASGPATSRILFLLMYASLRGVRVCTLFSLYVYIDIEIYR